MSDDIHKRLSALLHSCGWPSGPEPFEIEFWGKLSVRVGGCGHLGMFDGTAQIQEVVTVALRPFERDPARPPMNIRQTLRAGTQHYERIARSLAARTSGNTNPPLR
jgi:hypothetical protein